MNKKGRGWSVPSIFAITGIVLFFGAAGWWKFVGVGFIVLAVYLYKNG